MAVTSKQERPCHSLRPAPGQLQMPFLRYHKFLFGKKDRAQIFFFFFAFTTAAKMEEMFEMSKTYLHE